MSRTRKLLLGAGALLGAFVLFLALAPFLFRDRIVERIRAAVDDAVEADVSWSRVGVSFFRDFPNLTLMLDGLAVVGVEPFAGDTLAAMERFRFELDLGSVLGAVRGGGPVVVRSVRLEQPVLALRVLEDGRASWDIVRDSGAPEEAEAPPTEEGGARNLGLELRGLEIVGGRVLYDDVPGKVYASLEGLDHSLRGNFSRDSLVAETTLRVEEADVRFAGTPYLAGASIDFSADASVDLAGRRISLLDNELRLNDLVLRLTGDVASLEERTEIDLAFEAPRTEFGEILSLVPVVYRNDFASLETSGSFSLGGSVRGAYGPEDFPALDLALEVRDGSFRYPDLPLPARAIAADLRIRNPGGDADSTEVRLEGFHVEIGGQPIDARATLRTPISDPDVDAAVRGTLDLGALSRTVKLDAVDELAGVVVADAAARARMSDLDSARYERVAASGTVTLRGVTVSGADLRQPVAIEEAALALSPERAELETFRATLGSSDVQASGRLENLLGFVLRDEPLRGGGSFTSRRFVLDEWRSEDSELAAIPVPAALDLELEGAIDLLTLDALEMRNARGRLTIRNERITLEGFGLETLGGRIAMTGHYETLDPARPTFAFDLGIDSLDIAAASEALLTVRTMAPVARYAQGRFSADLDLSGAFGPDLVPEFDALTGTGALATSQITIQDFPVLERLSERLRMTRLDDPTFSALRSSVEIRDGRLHVEPFDVAAGPVRFTVDGSNGFDQSLDYTLGLTVPGALLEGTPAGGAVRELASRLGTLVGDPAAADSVRLGVRIGGTIADPALDLGFDEAASTAAGAARRAAEAEVERRIDETRAQVDAEVDAAREEARRRAAERADSLVADAEGRAETIRREAREVADRMRAEGERAAQEVLDRASNPIARAAAGPVADRLRAEANERADAVVTEADERANALVEEARRRADQIRESPG